MLSISVEPRSNLYLCKVSVYGELTLRGKNSCRATRCKEIMAAWTGVVTVEVLRSSKMGYFEEGAIKNCLRVLHPAGEEYQR